MGFLPSPTDILKFWWDSKTKQHERVSSYLQAVAEEAKRLALEWHKFANELEGEIGKHC